MPHPNSLMFNVYVIPFYPMKVYWFFRKVLRSDAVVAAAVPPRLPNSP